MLNFVTLEADISNTMTLGFLSFEYIIYHDNIYHWEFFQTWCKKIDQGNNPWDKSPQMCFTWKHHVFILKNIYPFCFNNLWFSLYNTFITIQKIIYISLTEKPTDLFYWKALCFFGKRKQIISQIPAVYFSVLICIVIISNK